MLASPRLSRVTASLSLPEKREYLALLEQRARLKREREERERIEAEAGGWEAEKAKCAADPLYWFDRYALTPLVASVWREALGEPLGPPPLAPQ